MTPFVACVVCARPSDALLTSGLQAGVAVLALLALGMVAAIVRAAIVIAREDARHHDAATGSEAPR
jgi:hypothetical protein